MSLEGNIEGIFSYILPHCECVFMDYGLNLIFIPPTPINVRICKYVF